jgi:hypothetical protein
MGAWPARPWHNVKVTSGAILQHEAEDSGAKERLEASLAVLFGVALTIAMQGYQFGTSNHTVYLLDAMRHADPRLLRHDWFSTQTLQYHAAFGVLTRWLDELHVVEPAFLAGYVAMAVLLHLAWWKLVRALGGGIAAFGLSEIFYHLSAGGTGLGMYQFLQDASFLPSNIASVVMLWGVYLWVSGRRASSAVMLGVSGLFHLNFAIIAPAVWVALGLWSWRADRRKFTLAEIFAALAMLGMCLINIIPAAAVATAHPRAGAGPMPLHEFIDLYVRLRHPHHYDPSSWPMALWISFVWPIPFACMFFLGQRRDRRPGGPVEEAWRIFAVCAALLLIALVGAGIWYWSETLVQMSLWRFSVYVKLLSCIGAALWIGQRLHRRRRAIVGASMIVGGAMILGCTLRGPYFGLFRFPEDDALYLQVCDWVRLNTPVDAVFLVPPDEQAFRLRARRAIVINFKAVPQLATELPGWRDRLERVLNLPDLRRLPRPMPRTLQAIASRYDQMSAAHLTEAAREYGARYILTRRPLDLPAVHRWKDRSGDRYFLYDLAHSPGPEGPVESPKEASDGRRRAMDVQEVQRRMLERYGIRVEPEMSAYVLRRLNQAGGALRELAVIGGEARTGVPTRTIVNLEDLQQPHA